MGVMLEAGGRAVSIASSSMDSSDCSGIDVGESGRGIVVGSAGRTCRESRVGLLEADIGHYRQRNEHCQ